jgi:hypothetical protein
MKIIICGSASFEKEKLDIKEKLEKVDVEGIINELDEKLARGEEPELLKAIQKDHSSVKRKYNFIKKYYKYISESDGILVTNFDKKGIKNYIGANTFLEMGYAHVLDKKIFLLNGMPEQDYIIDEIKIFKPTILNGDLTKIK